MSNEMVTRKTWEEFRNSRLLWWVNRSLHLFGWAIVLDIEGDKVTDVYPARVKFRGFSEANETEGFIGLTEHLKTTIDELTAEVKD